jgi:L-iditol 2-dehydrogenase
MRVAMYYNNRDVRIEEIPTPKIGPGEILVKVMASGICGSDVMEWYRIKKAPLVLGHEITGEIVEVGSGVNEYKTGDRVFVSHHVPCNTCHYCLNGHHTACETLHRTNYDPGGFAEYIRVPEINVERGVYLLPDEISYEDGTFIEPLACVVRGQRLAGLRPGQSILIMGSGISGLLHLKLARALGAGRIITTDINDHRLRVAEDYGADAVINAGDDVRERLLQYNDNRLADIVIVCAGALSAAVSALECVDRGGTVLFFAVPEPDVKVPVPMNALWRNEITMITSYGASPLDILVAIRLMQSRRLSLTEMITHRLSLDQAGLGFQLVANAEESIKVIIEPHKG